jgi:amino acid adenylation domain-containing protein
MVILQNQGSWSFSGDEPGGLQVSPFTEYEQEISKFDLAFNFEEAGEELLVSIEYNADLFDQTTIERLLMHLERLIGVIIDKPDVAVKRLDYLTEGERWELLVKFNDTSMAYPADRTVIDVFCEQALRTPDAIAVIFEGRKLTYLELHERSDELALYLKAHYEVQPNDLVAIQLDRSEWMVIAMLGVLKSGAAFVPIDPTYPSDRIQYMLTDSCSKVAFNDQELLNFQKELYLYTANKVLSVHSPADLAYVIYTSGSTGRPKGVMIEHRGLLNMSLSQKKTLDLKEGEGTLQFASLSFDASCYEIFNTLLSGGFLLIPSKETILSTTALSELINLYRPSLAVLPPSFHALMEEVGGSFTTIVSAGEALKLSTAKKIIARGVHLINAYGPTEATICATLSHVPIVNNSRITIGKPVANTSIFILDADGHLVPVGVSGELYIGGVQLARGYLNKEKITADSFIPNPYRPGERMYRSGDLARWLPDGNIEFLGRKDDQVKVRGYRLELGEIESVLLDHPDIDMAVVVAVNTPTGSQLAGYITARIPLSVSELRSYLLKVLPSFMAPPYFVQLDEMPLTPNGKIDRKRLPDPIGAGLCVQAEYVAPRNHTDEKLVAFWQEILGRTNIGIRDDFFELGGHSIHAAQLLSRINAFFSVHISLQIIFSEPTIENLSDQISFLLYQGRQKQSKHKFVQIDL